MDTVSHTQLLQTQTINGTGAGPMSSRTKPQPGMPNQRPPLPSYRLSEWTPVQDVTYSRYSPPEFETDWGGLAQNLLVGVALIVIVAGVFAE